MDKQVLPGQLLLKMPSLRAMRYFVAAAREQSFTRAAETLCVTQAAVSRQIKELEEHLGTALFRRTGRAVALTPAGSILFDSAQLSFINIAQAAIRIRHSYASTNLHMLTLCCSPAFSALWIAPRLAEFFGANPDISLNVVTTPNLLSMELGIQPDVFITKMSKVRNGYVSTPLFHDLIYPVCSPAYLAAHPEIGSIEGLMTHGMLLDLSPYERGQIAEHVDWGVWLAIHQLDIENRTRQSRHYFSANDYNLLIQMALNGQGLSLGWHHLVAPLVRQGRLVRPVEDKVELEEARHYLAYREDKADDEALGRLRNWFLAECGLAAESSSSKAGHKP